MFVKILIKKDKLFRTHCLYSDDESIHRLGDFPRPLFAEALAWILAAGMVVLGIGRAGFIWYLGGGPINE